MGFFTRIPFDDNQIKQLTGDTITLSGETNFSGTLKSKGIEIDASTGGTGNTGQVLTLGSGGTIQLKINTAAGSGAYDGDRAITQKTQLPIFAGNVGGTTVAEFLDGYFFPDVPPTVSIQLFSGLTTRQFGDDTDSATGDDLYWEAQEFTNPILLSGITVNGILYDPATGTTGLTTGFTNYVAPVADYSPPTGSSTIQTESFTINADTGLRNVSSNVTIIWKHKVFWFAYSTVLGSTGATIIEGIMNTGTTLGSSFAQVISRVFPTVTLSGQYFYYAYPKHFGTPVFTVNGLPNTAWGIAPNSLFTIDYTNTDGYTEQYYIATSDNNLTNSFDISVV